MRGRFHTYGFVLGLLLGLLIGVFTGSIALWMAIGVLFGIAISRGRFGRRLPRNQEIEILPPERTMRTR